MIYRCTFEFDTELSINELLLVLKDEMPKMNLPKVNGILFENIEEI